MAVDGQMVDGLRTAEIQELIQGPAGSNCQVCLAIQDTDMKNGVSHYSIIPELSRTKQKEKKSLVMVMDLFSIGIRQVQASFESPRRPISSGVNSCMETACFCVTVTRENLKPKFMQTLDPPDAACFHHLTQSPDARQIPVLSTVPRVLATVPLATTPRRDPPMSPMLSLKTSGLQKAVSQGISPVSPMSSPKVLATVPLARRDVTCNSPPSPLVSSMFVGRAASAVDAACFSDSEYDSATKRTVTLARGTNGSVGIRFKRPEGATVGPIEVMSVLPNSAAEMSGQLRAGDFFTAIDGQEVSNLDDSSVVELFRGSPSTTYTLSLCLLRPYEVAAATEKKRAEAARDSKNTTATSLLLQEDHDRAHEGLSESQCLSSSTTPVHAPFDETVKCRLLGRVLADQAENGVDESMSEVSNTPRAGNVTPRAPSTPRVVSHTPQHIKSTRYPQPQLLELLV